MEFPPSPRQVNWDASPSISPTFLASESSAFVPSGRPSAPALTGVFVALWVILGIVFSLLCMTVINMNAGSEGYASEIVSKRKKRPAIDILIKSLPKVPYPQTAEYAKYHRERQFKRQRTIPEGEQNFIWNDEMDDVEDVGVCSICLNEFKTESTEMCKELSCEHCFHAECLDRWLRIKDQCPLCKSKAAPLAVDRPNGSVQSRPANPPTTTATVMPLTTSSSAGATTPSQLAHSLEIQLRREHSQYRLDQVHNCVQSIRGVGEGEKNPVRVITSREHHLTETKDDFGSEEYSGDDAEPAVTGGEVERSNAHTHLAVVACVRSPNSDSSHSHPAPRSAQGSGSAPLDALRRHKIFPVPLETHRTPALRMHFDAESILE